MGRCALLQRTRPAERAQSLVETALFLPLLLLLLAAALEVSNILITQNRVQTAARAAAGFGAANYDPTAPITHTFNAMSMVALNNVTQTVQLEEDRWDIYTVKATVNSDGSGFNGDPWDAFGHPYGDGSVYPQASWQANEAAIEHAILCAILGAGEEEASCENSAAAGLEIIAAITYHNRQSFIGLGYFNPGLTRIRGLTVMRISQTQGSNDGCDLFPLALHLDNLSLYPQNFAGTMVAGGKMFTSEKYTEGRSHIVFSHAYDDEPYDHSGFPLAEGGHPLTPGGAMPARGDLFEAREADGAGGFGWVSWTADASAPRLAESLAPPGNLTLAYPAPPGSVNYVDPHSPDTTIPGVGHWVHKSAGTMNSSAVLAQIDNHINANRQIQILVYDQAGAAGTGLAYRIAGFAQLYLRGRASVEGANYLLVEFISWAEPCRAPAPG